MAVDWISTSNLQVYKKGMDQWLLAVTSDTAAKGSAKDLEVAGAGLVHYHFSLPPSSLAMCSCEHCLSLMAFHCLSIEVSVFMSTCQQSDTCKKPGEKLFCEIQLQLLRMDFIKWPCLTLSLFARLKIIFLHIAPCMQKMQSASREQDIKSSLEVLVLNNILFLMFYIPFH